MFRTVLVVALRHVECFVFRTILVVPMWFMFRTILVVALRHVEWFMFRTILVAALRYVKWFMFRTILVVSLRHVEWFMFRTILAVPIVDGINWDNMAYYSVYDSRHHRGIFEWGFLYKESVVPEKELATPEHASEPYK